MLVTLTMAGCSDKKEETTVYIVTFNANGGSPTPQEQTVEAGETATAPDSPTKQDYVFLFWSLDNAATPAAYDFENPVISNITLVAQWEEEKVLPDPDGTIECVIDAEGHIIIIHDLKDNKENSYDLHSFFSWSFPDNISMTNNGYYPDPNIDISGIDFSGFGTMSSFISNVGKVNGLNDIIEIPNSDSFGNKLYSEAGYGYVINFMQFHSIYARLYVVGPIVNNSGSAIGVKVKYQYPFEP